MYFGEHAFPFLVVNNTVQEMIVCNQFKGRTRQVEVTDVSDTKFHFRFSYDRLLSCLFNGAGRYVNRDDFESPLCQEYS